MTTTLLAAFPSPPQGVWYLGPVPIRAYAMCIIVGIVVALVLGDRRWAARGGERGVIYDIALWAVPFGLIGGRLYHLITDWRTYFGDGGVGPAAALRIWDGGLGIWGAVALGGVGAWIGCRGRGIPLPAFADAVAPGIVLAQAIGRMGNYFNQELYGRETVLPWGLEIFTRRNEAGIVDPHLLDGVSTGQVYAVVHPTFLYELLWNVLVFVMLIYVDRRFVIGHGRLFALYVAGYCVGRFGVELLRDDIATHIAGIRVNSFTSTFVLIGAVVYMMLAPRGREDPATLGGGPVGVPASTRVEEAVVAEGDVEPVETEDEAPEAEPEPAVESAGEESVVAEGDVEPVETEDEAPEPEPEPEPEAEPAVESESEPEPESAVEEAVVAEGDVEPVETKDEAPEPEPAVATQQVDRPVAVERGEAGKPFSYWVRRILWGQR